jgi:hypothetical protein
VTGLGLLTRGMVGGASGPGATVYVLAPVGRLRGRLRGPIGRLRGRMRRG